VYRNYLGRPLPSTAVFTRDLDCVTRNRVPLEGAGASESLQAAGFIWIPRGDGTLPAAVFVWPAPDAPEIEVEFLVPARGDGRHRIVPIQPNLGAQALRHLDILLDDPLGVELNEGSADRAGLRFNGAVRVPRLSHFSIQKALIFDSRAPDDRVKDLTYVFDLIDSTNGLADALLTDDVRARGAGYQAGVQRFRAVLGREFRSPAFVKQVVEQIPQERRPLSAFVEREVAQWLARLEAALAD
jgi:hypothetical protein